MSDDRSGFDELFRRIAEGVQRGLERASEDLDDLARANGVDPDDAKRWMDGAAEWLNEQLGGGARPAEPAGRPGGPLRADDPLQAATPHPLDIPTSGQGVALAALDSGRWALEPGTSVLIVRGDGPGPSDALGLVHELRVRDWLDAEGQMTLAGRRALERWLAVAER